MTRSRALLRAAVAAGLAVVVVLTAPPVPAEEHEEDLVGREAPLEASEVLERMARAEGATYHARQLVVYMGQPQSAAVLDIRSSADGTFVRSEAGSGVTRLWRRPHHGLVSGAKESMEDKAPPAAPLRTDDVLAKYEVGVGEATQLLGVTVLPITLTRRSDRVRVEQFWVHPSSGVVYRRELYGAGGELVGMSTLLDMWWGEWAAPERFDAANARPAQVEVVSSHEAPSRMPYGYSLLQAYSVPTEDGESQHWVYSDGLHVLSVFRTPGALRPPKGFERLEGADAWVGPGPGTWAWEGGGSSWVVVAEEPALDLEELAERFPREGRSIWARLGSVWSRLFGWIASLF